MKQYKAGFFLNAKSAKGAMFAMKLDRPAAALRAGQAKNVSRRALCELCGFAPLREINTGLVAAVAPKYRLQRSQSFLAVAVFNFCDHSLDVGCWELVLDRSAYGGKGLKRGWLCDLWFNRAL
jgi:hypothetical protein